MDLVLALLDDIQENCQSSAVSVVLTLNVPETLPDGFDRFRFPLTVVRNKAPQGFGANHNQAFVHAQGDYFCVINPDVRLPSNIFPDLCGVLVNTQIGVAAPLIRNPQGQVEDSARSFPTPWRIARKALGFTEPPLVAVGPAPLSVEWVAGMFMVFRRDTFQKVGGFDDRYFLYYEDVDLCARVWLSGRRVVQVSSLCAIHNARRSSHSNRQYLRWHLRSMARFFTSGVFMRAMLLRGRGGLP
jgi:N-acetylglucosaminyl-diphospho-decaprenol L-rhamnosyltransferase